MSEFDTETMAFPAVELPGEFDASTLPAATVPRPARPLPWRRWLSQPRWLSLATVLGLCAGWWWVTALQLVPPLFLPSPKPCSASCTKSPPRATWTPPSGNI